MVRINILLCVIPLQISQRNLIEDSLSKRPTAKPNLAVVLMKIAKFVQKLSLMSNKTRKIIL